MSERKPTIGSNQQHWDNEAENWHPDRHFYANQNQDPGSYNFLRRQALTLALAQFLPLTGDWGFDVGSGPGSQVYLGEGIQTQNVLLGDISSNMLKQSEAPHRIQLDLSQPLPLETNVFDWAISFFVMRYLTELEQVLLLKEIIRVLKPGCPAVIIDNKTLKHAQERGSFNPSQLMAAWPGNQVTFSVQELLPESPGYQVVVAAHRGIVEKKTSFGPLYLLAMQKK